MRSVGRAAAQTGGGRNQEERKQQGNNNVCPQPTRLSCERGERHMEATLRNLSSTVELLAAAAHSGAVQQWDEQTLSRAFHWARYCEHLCSRFHSNPTVRGVMEKQIQLTNEGLRAAIPGYTEVSFLDLSQCQHHLLLGLLNNPQLPSSIMRTLFDPKAAADTNHSEYQDVAGLCSRIIQCKSACKVLKPVTEPLSAAGADAEVQGMMLMERLGASMSQSSTEACRTEQFLDSILHGCEGAAEHFCLVIAAALLTTGNSATQTALQGFLMDWLQKRNILKYMCSALPAALLTDLVKTCLKFRNVYCDVLKQWASDMEYSLTEGEWVQTGTNTSVSFQKLTESFQALFETCPSVRGDMEKELNDLKVSDGDFDVRGLSVWGDLLSALNR